MRLKRNNRGSIVLPSGETITIREQKALRSYVNTVNAKSKRLLEKLPKEVQRNYTTFGGETDFHIRKKSYGYYKTNPSTGEKVSRFANKKEFNTYLRSLKHIADKGFEKKRANTVYSNYIRSLYNTFGDRAKEVVNLAGQIDPQVLDFAMQSGDIESVGYVYNDPTSVTDKLTSIKASLIRLVK